jgi:hypothetical protein
MACKSYKQVKKVGMAKLILEPILSETGLLKEEHLPIDERDLMYRDCNTGCFREWKKAQFCLRRNRGQNSAHCRSYEQLHAIGTMYCLRQCNHLFLRGSLSNFAIKSR